MMRDRPAVIWRAAALPLSTPRAVAEPDKNAMTALQLRKVSRMVSPINGFAGAEGRLYRGMFAEVVSVRIVKRGFYNDVHRLCFCSTEQSGIIAAHRFSQDVCVFPNRHPFRPYPASAGCVVVNYGRDEDSKSQR